MKTFLFKRDEKRQRLRSRPLATCPPGSAWPRRPKRCPSPAGCAAARRSGPRMNFRPFRRISSLFHRFSMIFKHFQAVFEEISRDLSRISWFLDEFSMIFQCFSPQKVVRSDFRRLSGEELLGDALRPNRVWPAQAPAGLRQQQLAGHRGALRRELLEDITDTDIYISNSNRYTLGTGLACLAVGS